MLPTFTMSGLLSIHAAEDTAYARGDRYGADRLFDQGVWYLDCFSSLVPHDDATGAHAMDLATYLTGMGDECMTAVHALAKGATSELKANGSTLTFQLAIRAALEEAPTENEPGADYHVNDVLVNVLKWAEKRCDDPTMRRTA